MTYRRIVFSIMFAAALAGYAKQLNPLTQAMFDGYAELLARNPKDYLTYYERAAQYYRLSDYDSALSDAKKAIEYTPVKDKEQLATEYSLLADIYQQVEQYEDALTAINKGIELNPNTLDMFNTKGNICLYLKRYEEAEKAYAAMQRINPRSSEALFGMARAALNRGHNDVARRYMDDAEKLGQNNYLTYCRLGDLHRELGERQLAASDYLNAFTMTSNTERPMSSLMSLAEEDFYVVEKAVEGALTKTQNVIPLYFLLGSAANRCGKYAEAYEAMRQLLDTPQGDSPDLLSELAAISLRTGDLTQADNYASRALAAAPSVKNYLLKARIEDARCNYTATLLYTESALTQEPYSTEGLILAANAEYKTGNKEAAYKHLTNAIMADAENREALIFRGFLQANGVGGATNTADFKRIASMEAKTNKELTYKAIAQALSGTPLDASSTIAAVKKAADTNAEASMLAAIYEAAVGNESQARLLIDKARNAGYEDEYVLKYYTIPLLSISSIR